MSFEERERRGVDEDEHPHYWGAEGRKEAFAPYIVCSFMPSWGMVQGHEEELAVIVFEAETICCKEGVLFCPTNSAKSIYSIEAILQMEGIEAFDSCFPNPETYQAGDSEIFVPGVIPLTAFRGLLFCDQEAYEYWWPKIQDAYAGLASPPAQPETPITVRSDGAAGLWGFRFPGNWKPKERIRP